MHVYKFLASTNDVVCSCCHSERSREKLREIEREPGKEVVC
jgi:hypothetical protein